MNYISREDLIDLILLEHVWRDKEGQLRATYDDAIPEEISPLEAGKTYNYDKKGRARNAKWIKALRSEAEGDGNKMLYYFPPGSTFRAAVPSASDDGIAWITCVSEFCAEFGMIPMAYTTKTLAFNDDYNEADIKAQLRMITEILKFFPSGSPIEIIDHVINNSTSELEKIYKVRFDVLLGLEKEKTANFNLDWFTRTGKKPALYGNDLTWASYLKIDSNANDDEEAKKHLPGGYNVRLLNAIREYINVFSLSADQYTLYKQIYSFLKDIALSEKFRTPAAFAKRIEKNEEIRIKLTGDILGKVFSEVMSKYKFNTVDDLATKMVELIKSKEQKKSLGHAPTVIIYKLAEALDKWEPLLDDFPALIDHLREHNRFRYKELLNNFELSEEELKSFKTFHEFSRYVFSKPELIVGLYKRSGLNERSRSKDTYREGSAGAVDARGVKKQIERAAASRQEGIPEKQRKLKSKSSRKVEYNDSWKPAIKSALKKAQLIGDTARAERLNNILKKISKRSKTLGDAAWNLDKKIKKAMEETPELLNVDAKQLSAQKMEGLQEKLHEYIMRVVNAPGNEGWRDEILGRHDKDGSIRKRMEQGADSGSIRIVSYFDIIVPSAVYEGNKKFQEDLLTYFDFQSVKLKKSLNKAEEKAGKERLVDVYVTPEISSRGMILKVEIEYSNKSTLYKKYEENPMALEDIAEKLLKPFPESSNIRVKGAPKVNKELEW